MGSPPLPPRPRAARRPRRRPLVALRRRPLAFWVLTLAAAASTYLSVDAAVTRSATGAAAYGPAVQVAVATRDLPAGAVLGAGDVDIRPLAADLVPAGAARSAPVGRALRADVVAGEAIVPSRLAPEGAIGVAATLDPDERAVAVPIDGHRPPIEAGQRVDVLATVDPSLVAGRNPTTVVVESARVVSVAEEGITVAVPVAGAERLATALATAVVTVVVAPG